ncbi:MAG: hypothetical protein QM621_09615 [Aeromicrobium sp.]|uniref:hypothetical protein n=1 Tax=Aeromicrobium sp. TaxID=1871063 RepID=UPI0039E2794B
MTDDETGYWFEASMWGADWPPREPGELGSGPRAFREAWRGGDTPADRLRALRALNPKKIVADWWNSPSKHDAFAEANGLTFERHSYESTPGSILRFGERRDIYTWEGPPTVEFGNHHSPVQRVEWLFGYIAVDHALSLPRMVLDARANDATPPRGHWIYADKSHYSSLGVNFRGSDSASPSGRSKDGRTLHTAIGKLELLDLGPETGRLFQAFVEPGRESDARAFLSGDALRLMGELSATFDIGITENRIFLYLSSVEVSWFEADRWAWVFSVASQVLDRLGLWDPAVPERPAFYTDRCLPAPDWMIRRGKPSPGFTTIMDGIFGNGTGHY